MPCHIHKAQRLICEVKQASTKIMSLFDVLTEGEWEGVCMMRCSVGGRMKGKVCVKERNG